MTYCCHYCGQPVDPLSRTTSRRITGWERKATSDTRRGGSDIILREPLDMFACHGCIQRLQAGVAPAQETLI